MQGQPERRRAVLGEGEEGGARARRGELDGYAPPEGEGATGNAAVKEAGAAGGGGASGVVEGEE